jgi:hypothetical protein
MDARCARPFGRLRMAASLFDVERIRSLTEFLRAMNGRRTLPPGVGNKIKKQGELWRVVFGGQNARGFYRSGGCIGCANNVRPFWGAGFSWAHIIIPHCWVG